MWLTPSSTARRSTPIERPRSLGAPRSKAALPVRRIAPSPTRLTVRSPSCQVPAAAALITCSGMISVLSMDRGNQSYAAVAAPGTGHAARPGGGAGQLGKADTVLEPSLATNATPLAGSTLSPLGPLPTVTLLVTRS